MSPEPAKVLRVIPTIDPKIGGPSNSSVNQVIAESGEKFETTMVTTANSRELERMDETAGRLAAAGVELLAFPYASRFGTRGSTLGISFGLVRWLVSNVGRYEVVHLHYVWSLTTLVGAFLAKAKNVPVVMTAHESLTEYDIAVTSGSRLKRTAKRIFRRLLMKRVDCVICASEIELRDSIRPGERGVVIAHPVVRAVRESSREQSADGFRVGFLGRLHPKKGLARLIEAMPLLGDDVSLIVCGDGDPEFTVSLKDMALGLGVGGEIDWRGYVGPEARQELFDSVDWIVMPSDYECFGMAAAEALSAGVPVVVSRQTGIAPIVEENRCGFVVDLATANGSLGRCLRELKESTGAGEWAELSRNALRATRRSLTYEAYRSAIWPLYESLIRSRAK